MDMENDAMDMVTTDTKAIIVEGMAKDTTTNVKVAGMAQTMTVASRDMFFEHKKFRPVFILECIAFYFK